MISIRPNPLAPFRVLYELPKGTWMVINIGGRGGGKSYEVSKYIILQAIIKQKRCAVLRDQQSTIAQSILHEIKSRFAEIDEKSGGYYSIYYDMQDKGLKNINTETMQIFTKGFQTSSTTKKASLKSIADVDIAVIEEFEDIDDEDKFNTFADSIRKEDALIIINSNVPSKNHWFIKRYFNLEESNFEGFYHLLPKTIPGVVYINSSFEDNPHLSQTTISRYRAYGDPNSSMYNPAHYCSDILGLASEGKKGVIFKNWKPITAKKYYDLEYDEFFGQDFGYSSDPAALVGLKHHNNRLYIKQYIYQTGLTNPDLSERYSQLGLSNHHEIYADSAEPKSIAELKKQGWNVIPSVKGADSVRAGINYLLSMEVYYVESDEDMVREKDMYSWALNANQEPTDKPEDKNNHLMDAIRYGVYTKLAEPAVFFAI